MDFDILPVLADPFLSDVAFEQFDHELDAVHEQWAGAIGQVDFAALQFTIENAGGVVGGGILSQSTRAGDCYQLTRLDAGGIPLSHHDYYKNDLSALLDDLPYSTEKITIHVNVMRHGRNKNKKGDDTLSLEGDTADKMVHEGLEITETAVKLAGLGAKNLAALLLALLRDNVKLKGKTSMNRLLRTDKPLATFTIKREDLAVFKKQATSHGVLFSAVHNAQNGKGLCDVIARAEDAGRINQIIEALGYNAPIVGEGKNAMARAQPDGKSNGRGFGWLQQAMERMNDPVRQFENKTGGLESLGAETLAAMVLKVAGENREFHEAQPLARLFEDGKDIQIFKMDAIKAGGIQQQAKLLNIPVHFYSAQESGAAHFVAKSEDAPVINRICENMGLAPPMRTGPEEKATHQPQKRGPGRPPKQPGEKATKTPVRDRIEGAKAQAKGEKADPAKTSVPKTKAPKPKAPAR